MAGRAVRETMTVAGTREQARMARAFMGAVLGHAAGDAEGW